MSSARELELQLEQQDPATEKNRLMQSILDLGLRSESVNEGLHAAIVLKEKGDADGAGKIFKRLRSLWPDDSNLSYEFVQYLRRVGSQQEGDQELLRSSRRGDGGERVLTECLVRGLIEQPKVKDRAAILQQLIVLLTAKPNPYLQAAAHYLSTVPVAATLREVEGYTLQALDETFQRLSTAIESRTPFCLLRLGDGEGAFLHAEAYPPSEEHLFATHRRFFTSRWYGDESLASDPGFLAAASQLRAGLVEADILGVPNTSWLDHEIRMRNIRSIVNCLEVSRTVSVLGLASSGKLTTTTVAVDLEFRGLVSKLLRICGPVVLITSHAGLGERLNASGLAPECETVLVPPAHSDARHTGYPSGGSHFHEVYKIVNEKIAKLPTGAVVFVSAGFLGKLYALEVRRNGGIAIDIGSLADLWMGHMTRPSFFGLRHIALSDYSDTRA